MEARNAGERPERRASLPPVSEIVPEHERPGEPTLAPGMERRDQFTVEGPLVTDVGGTIGIDVLSTPAMIAVMERCSSILALSHLPAGHATVGFEVCVKHVAAAPAGARCHVRSTLREIVDGRKLHFDVEVTDGERTVGIGTHQRRVIEVGALTTD